MGVSPAFTGKLQRICPSQLLPEKKLYISEHEIFRNYLIKSSPPPPPRTNPGRENLASRGPRRGAERPPHTRSCPGSCTQPAKRKANNKTPKPSQAQTRPTSPKIPRQAAHPDTDASLRRRCSPAAARQPLRSPRRDSR